MKVVKLLVKCGADIYAQDDCGDTAEDAAYNNGSWKYQHSKSSLNTIWKAESESGQEIRIAK